MTTTTTTRDDQNLKTGSWLMTVGAVAFIAYAIVFFVLNFTDSFLELGIGPDQVDVGRAEIEAFSPALFNYIGHLHIAVAGFIAAMSVAVLFLIIYGVRRGEFWAWLGAVAAPVVGLAVALPAHYPNSFDTLAHLGPVYLGTAIFVVGALMALPGVMRRNRNS